MNINFTEHKPDDCTVFLDGNIMATGLTRSQAEIATQLMRITAEKCGRTINTSFDVELTQYRYTDSKNPDIALS